jgi:hypothetical protein
VRSNSLHPFEEEVERHECESMASFIRHVAVNHVSRGYFFYVVGRIPFEKEPAKTDRKIMSQYDIGGSKWANHRARKRGEATVKYFRCNRVFVILATHGEHPFFKEEHHVKDFRREPLSVGGYRIAVRGRPGRRRRVSVAIAADRFRALLDFFRKAALREEAREIQRSLASLRLEPYAPVQRQAFAIVKEINRVRCISGLEPVSFSALQGLFPHPLNFRYRREKLPETAESFRPASPAPKPKSRLENWTDT